jgi:trk system potassium uptake protein TrkA
VIDRSREAIDAYGDRSVSAVVMEVLSEAGLRRVLPAAIDGVVIDMGEKVEASILATSYCRKIGVSPIIVKAETEEHAEILELVGATKVVFPNREAAKRVTPLMLSSALLNYLPVSGKLVIAELAVPDRFVGQSLLEVNLRKKHGLNLISVKNGEEEYGLFSPEYVFRNGDVALVSGTDEMLESFSQVAGREGSGKLLRSVGDLGKLFGIGRK